jgi:hypothetical protein
VHARTEWDRRSATAGAPRRRAEHGAIAAGTTIAATGIVARR